MRLMTAIFTVALLAGCDAANDQAPASTNVSEPSPPAAPATSVPGDASSAAATSTTASATGTVQSVDTAAKSVVIAHGPVEALKWPAMTMTFQAPGVDLSAIKPGDQVSFEFTSTGMDGTIISITKQ